MDPLKINESEQDAWLQQYHAHQHQMERPSVLQPVHSMPPLPSPPATSETSDSQMTSQHPHLAAQLSASLANQNNQQSSSNSSGDGVPPFNSEQFPFSGPFSTSQFFTSRPSVVQHTPNHFEPFQNPLFPFPNYFGFPGMTGIPSGIDHRFNQTEGLLKQGADDGGPLFPKPLTQDELLFSHFNSFSAAYNPMTLESILKEQKKVIKTESPSRLPIYHSDQPPILPVPRANPECQVCQTTQANGLHFGARTCAACAAFFRRTISDEKKYVCKRSQRCNNPQKDSTGYRKICRACRLKRCMDIGMLPENVQHKRTRADSPSRHEMMVKSHLMMEQQRQDVPHTPILPTPEAINPHQERGHNPFDFSLNGGDIISPSLDSMFPLYNQLNFGHLDQMGNVHPPQI